MRIAVIGALAALVGFGVVTLVALEGREVVVLRTVDASGASRDTRTWIADEDDASWVEAANPERPFLRHIAERPAVELWRAGAWRSCHATSIASPEGHVRIRRLLAAKYGWADLWIGLLTDTSGSSAVRLDCAGPMV